MEQEDIGMPQTTTNGSSKYGTTKAEVFVVCVLCLLTAVFTTPYVICMLTMMKDKKLTARHPFYLLAINLGLVDLLQLANGPAVAILTLTRSGSTTGQFLANWTIGALLNSAWEAALAMISCMAVNRLVSVFCGQHLAKRIFSRRNTKICVTICWIYGCSWFLVYTLPGGAKVFYHFDLFCWDYGTTGTSNFFRATEFYADMIFTALMLICYVCILIKLKIKKSQVMSIEAMRAFKREWAILMQALLICINVLLCVLSFFFLPSLTENEWISLISNVTWISVVGMNCVVYICFNSIVRSKLLEMITGKKSVIQATVTVRMGKSMVTRFTKNNNRLSVVTQARIGSTLKHIQR